MVSFLHQMGRTQYNYGRPFYLGPYKENENPQDFTSPLQLPIIRVFCAGGTGVAVFFVISGYVLSLKPIQIIRRIETEATISKRLSLQGTLLETLSSSIFRRVIRLFLPCIASIFLFECMDAIGMFHIKHSAPGLWGYVLHFHYFLDIMSRAVWNIDGQMIGTLRHLWTVPVEFTCSMALFAVIIAISRFSTKGRMRCLTGLMIFALYYDHTGFFAFLGGMLIAEMEESRADSLTMKNKDVHEHDDSTTNPGPATPREATSSTLYYVCWVSVLLASFYVAGWPSVNLEKEPILRRVNMVLGRNRSLALACFAFINCLFRLPRMQTVFTKPFALYLGNISYAVYCVHYPFIIALEQGISSHVSTIFGPEREGHLNRFVANVYEAVLMQCIILWAADLFWRLVDIPVLKFARWMERRCTTEAS